MGLQPLEFSECFADSPYFRQNLHAHEKELERTSKAIKTLINEVKDLVRAAKELSKAQRSFSNTLTGFHFECLGVEQTDDEMTISRSLKEFGKLINQIEDARDRMLTHAYDDIVHRLDAFRKERIGCAKDGKKKFEKQTIKFCQSLEKYLGLKNKTVDQLQEYDVQLDMEKRNFYQASMEYVLILQDVQERKKFEFVESLMVFVYSWLTFYHQGHECAGDFKPYMHELQMLLQKCRDNFDTTHEQAETLMRKKLEIRGSKPHDHAASKSSTREGYLYVMERKPFGQTTWTKNYCSYQKENKILTMIPYNQMHGKGINNTDTVVLESCTRRASISIDKRFCFDITIQSDKTTSLTFQALSEEDFRNWLDAMDGKEPIYSELTNPKDKSDSSLDDVGFEFITRCIAAIESKGLNDEGLYRVVGVNSKVSKLISIGLDRRKLERLNLEDSGEWEVKTITSALKNYFRSLPEPIMTFKLHNSFIMAAKLPVMSQRVQEIHRLVHQLPKSNFEMLEKLMKHLKRISENSQKNLMPISNIGVCFGPTLMRSEEETISSIMDIKFCNIVVELIIEHYHKIFSLDDSSSCSAVSVEDSAESSQSQAGASVNNKDLMLPSTTKPFITHTKPTLPVRPPGLMSSAAPANCRTSSTNAKVTHGNPTSAAPHNHAAHGNVSNTLTSTSGCNSGSSSSMDSSKDVHRNVAHDNVSTAMGTCASTLSGGGTSSTGMSSGGNGGVANRKHSSSSMSSVVSNSSTSTPTSAPFSSAMASGGGGTQTYAQYRAKLRPTGSLYSQYAPGGEHQSSASSSSESLNSKSSALYSSNPSLSASAAVGGSGGFGGAGSVAVGRAGGGGMADSRTSFSASTLSGGSSVEGPGSDGAGVVHPGTLTVASGCSGNSGGYVHHTSDIRRNTVTDATNLTSSVNSALYGQIPGKTSKPAKGSSTTSFTSVSSGPPDAQACRRKVRTLYSCDAENCTELSFDPNQIIYNVRTSREPGWLEGTLDGKTGLIPANYVEFID